MHEQAGQWPFRLSDSIPPNVLQSTRWNERLKCISQDENSDVFNQIDITNEEHVKWAVCIVTNLNSSYVVGFDDSEGGQASH